jgi:hypothetical protein
VACCHRAGRSGRPPPSGPDRACAFGSRRWPPRRRPGVGRFAAEPSCLRRGPPQAAAGAGAPSLWSGSGPARPGGRSRAGTPPTRRHAARIPALSEKAPSPTWPSPAPALGSSRDISGAYVALGRARSWAAKGNGRRDRAPPRASEASPERRCRSSPAPPAPDAVRPRGASPSPAPAPQGRVDPDGAVVVAVPARGAATRPPSRVAVLGRRRRRLPLPGG